MSENIEKVDVLGVGISAVKMSDAVQQIERWIRTGGQHYVCACPNYSIIQSQKDDSLCRIMNEAGMATPDGRSVVWACRFLGDKELEQVCGADLMIHACDMAAQKGYSIFLYGTTESVLEELAKKLKQRFPELKVVGSYAPPFRPLTEQESENVIQMINAANPDILWVGLGSFKQERWMAHYVNYLEVPVMVGVGAAFDFLSGNKPGPPSYVVRAGLAWLFRLVREPRRLWKRNLYHPVFIGKIVIQKWFR